MARIIFELAGFFVLPFMAYAAFLVWQHRHPSAARAIFRRKALMVQSLIGLGIVAAFLLAFGFSQEPHRGAYAPAVFKDGTLVPGRVD